MILTSFSVRWFAVTNAAFGGGLVLRRITQLSQEIL
jgi:hypothetical protein